MNTPSTSESRCRLFVNLKRLRSLAFFAILSSLTLIAVIGCRSQDPEIGWIQKNYDSRPAPLNPYLVLDPAGFNVSSEEFGRRDWPASPEARKFVTTDERAVYRENIRDYSYSNAYGQPRNYYYYDNRGYHWQEVRR